MSNDQISVPRELLERLERMYMDGMSIYGECEEIRALLAQRCTCPSGDGSLRWPCPVHPPADPAWLWGKLMEWCRKRGVSPAGYSDLFELCGIQQGGPVCPPEQPATPATGWEAMADWLAYYLAGGVAANQSNMTDKTVHDALKAMHTYREMKKNRTAEAPVVLPEKKQESTSESHVLLNCYKDGWNACLDEFKRLNPGITEAAPLRKS